MEKTNQNEEQNITNQKEEQIANNQSDKKKITLSSLAVPGIIALILIVFAGVVFYSKVILPKKNIDKHIGYKVEDYISIDKYTGFDYEITQNMFDECVYEETDSNEEVERAAKDGDIVDVDYTGYIDGKKEEALTQEDAEITVGQETEKVFQKFSELVKGQKAGKKFEVKISGEDVNEIAEEGSDYTGKEVLFKVEINTVSQHIRDEVTDDWVKEYYYEDMGLENTEDFYNWCRDYIVSEAKVDVWNMAIEKTVMSSYPQDLYDKIVEEFTQDANYYAEEFGISSEEYLHDFCGYTDETLEEEYLKGVKSELLMWYIVKEQKFEATDEEIEAKYEELSDEMGYATVDEMKEEYNKDEIEEVVLLDKVQDYVYDNSNIKESFKMNN